VVADQDLPGSGFGIGRVLHLKGACFATSHAVFGMELLPFVVISERRTQRTPQR
jgi:hypothetical protein